MKATMARLVVTSMILAAAVTGVAGCGDASTAVPPRHGIAESDMTIHFSRTKLYSSMQELVDDTPLIVTGTVGNTRVDKDVDGRSHVTLHDVEIMNVVKGDAQPGETIVLRQTGKDDPSILKDSETALLFLLPSGLPGDLADQFFPKGVYAGIYMPDDGNDLAVLSSSAEDNASADGVDFSRLITDSGDDLPETISLGDIRRLADAD